MRRALLRSSLILLACIATLAIPAIGRSAPSGAEVFASHCAVCHGAKAEGIPGSFPPLGGQIRSFASLPAGRDYLVMAVSAGLIGSLSVAGGSYQGAMPPQSMLGEAEVAAVLNYLAAGLGKGKSAAPFDAAQVSAVRARHPGVSGAAALALRPTLPER